MTALGANEERLARLRAKVTKLGFGAFILLELEAAASIWGRWTAVATLGLLCAAGALANLSVNRLPISVGSRDIERLRTVANLAIILAICHLSGWGFAGLSMIVLVGAAQGASSGHETIGLTVAVALIGAGVAAADGAGLITALTLATAVGGAFLLVYGSARVGADLVEQLGARHQELAAAHAQLGKLQQAAIQQEKLAGLGLMAAGIAHEINNPMSYVMSNVVSLLADLRATPALPPPIREYVDEVLPETLDGIRRVNSIVKDLRRFARADVEEPIDYDLNEEVRSAVRLTRNRFMHGCELALDLAPLPLAKGHPRHIAQGVWTLLGNAADALHGPGTVRGQPLARGDEMVLAVRDAGLGMDEEVRSHLFQPFFTTKEVGKGTGLGLAVIHGIVEAHGGRIEVESAPGLGSCFTVILPLTPGARRPSPRDPTGSWRLEAALVPRSAS